jgi:hypothetical protein
VSNQFTQVFGWLSIGLAPLLGGWIYRHYPTLGLDSVLFASGTFAAAGAALVYAARSRLAGEDIGHKAFPATWVAWIFVFLMTWRMLSDVA